LAIRTEVLVAKALHDLEIAVKTRNYQQLFEDLGRLGEGIEGPLVDPAGDEVVPGAFGGALGQEGRLHLDEPLFLEIVPRNRGGPAAQEKIFLDFGAAQIEITVFQADVLGDLVVAVDHEGRGPGFVEDFQLQDHDLDGACFQLRIFHALGPSAYPSQDGQDVFATNPVGLLVALGAEFRVEDNLNQTGPVPQIDENDTAVVPAAMGPSHEDDFVPIIG